MVRLSTIFKIRLDGSKQFHLAQFVHDGLIAQRRPSRQLIYSAEYGAMNALLAYLTENCCGQGAACAPVCNPADAFTQGAKRVMCTSVLKTRRSADRVAPSGRKIKARMANTATPAQIRQKGLPRSIGGISLRERCDDGEVPMVPIITTPRLMAVGGGALAVLPAMLARFGLDKA